LFLSLKNGIVDQNLIKFITQEIYIKKIPMEMESIIIFMFTFTKIEKLIGKEDY